MSDCIDQEVRRTRRRTRGRWCKTLKKKTPLDRFCAYCGNTEHNGTGGNFEHDHIIPIENGGTNDEFNITTACSSCNCRKGTRNLDEFLNRMLSRKKPPFLDLPFVLNNPKLMAIVTYDGTWFRLREEFI